MNHPHEHPELFFMGRWEGMENKTSPSTDELYSMIDQQDITFALFEIAFKCLTEREVMILKSFFYEGKYGAQIAREIGLSTGRTFQILNRALRRLRHPLRNKCLEELKDCYYP